MIKKAFFIPLIPAFSLREKEPLESTVLNVMEEVNNG